MMYFTKTGAERVMKPTAKRSTGGPPRWRWTSVLVHPDPKGDVQWKLEETLSVLRYWIQRHQFPRVLLGCRQRSDRRFCSCRSSNEVMAFMSPTRACRGFSNI